MGYPRAGIVAQLDAVTPSGAKKARSWNRYALERRLLVRLRKNICDIGLRGRLASESGSLCHGDGAHGLLVRGVDVSVIVEAADDVTMVAVALSIAAGGAVKAAKTTPLLSGPQWGAALKKAPAVSAPYRPAR